MDHMELDLLVYTSRINSLGFIVFELTPHSAIFFARVGSDLADFLFRRVGSEIGEKNLFSEMFSVFGEKIFFCKEFTKKKYVSEKVFFSSSNLEIARRKKNRRGGSDLADFFSPSGVGEKKFTD